MANHSPPARTSASVACVSGPRRVKNVRPPWRLTTISNVLAAMDKNLPGRSL
jgi:hypothetical protein